MLANFYQKNIIEKPKLIFVILLICLFGLDVRDVWIFDVWEQARKCQHEINLPSCHIIEISIVIIY